MLKKLPIPADVENAVVAAEAEKVENSTKAAKNLILKVVVADAQTILKAVLEKEKNPETETKTLRVLLKEDATKIKTTSGA
jgi:hypothetical protein